MVSASREGRMRGRPSDGALGLSKSSPADGKHIMQEMCQFLQVMQVIV